jgi:stage V sporulation protein B
VQDSQSVTRNAAYLFGGQVVGATITAGLTLYLARALGPHEFGVFSLALAAAGTLLLPADFGVSQSAARFAAEHREQRSEVADVLASALRIKLYLAVALCAALFFLAGPIAAAYDEPDLKWALRAMALVLFGQGLMGLYGLCFTALGQAAYSFRLVFVKSIVEAVATVALVLVAAGAGEAALGRGIGFFIGGLFALVLSARLLGRASIGLGGDRRRSTRRIATYAGALFIVDSAFALFQQIDVLFIGAILTPAAAGLFQAPLRLIALLGYPAQSLASSVTPRLASSDGRGGDSGPFLRALRLTMIFQAALIAPLLVWAQPIMDLLLGEEYQGSIGVLRALAPFVFLTGLGALLSYAANYLGEARRRVPLAVGALLVNVVIDVTLIPVIGIEAGALGTDVAYGAYVVGHLWICTRLIDIPLASLAATFARSMLAAAVMAATLFAFGTEDIPVALLPIGGLLAGVAYLVTLVAARETSFTELASLARGLRSRFA